MSYKNIYKSEVRKRLKPISDSQGLTLKEIEPLPAPVQKYLIYAGAIGKPMIQNVRVVWSGAMKRNKNSGWMPITSHQYNFFDEPSRFFYIRAKMFGIPFDGLHVYAGNTATMQIKIASMFQVVDARGDKMNHGETVTVFNDMCCFAPSTLISENIEWETIDSLTVKAKFTNDKITVSAVLKFILFPMIDSTVRMEKHISVINGQHPLKILLKRMAGRYRHMEKRCGIYLMRVNSATLNSI